MSKEIAINEAAISEQSKIDKYGRFLKTVKFRDKRPYIIIFYESAAFVKAQKHFNEVNGESETIDVGTYLAKEKRWQCAYECILRLAIKSRVENFYSQQNSL